MSKCQLDITDDDTGGSRIFRRMCSTCIYRTDQRQRYPISDQDRDKWIEGVLSDDAYVVCHDSGPTRPAGVPAAICAGFWFRFREQSAYCRLIDWYDAAVYVEPPRPIPETGTSSGPEIDYTQ